MKVESSDALSSSGWKYLGFFFLSYGQRIFFIPYDDVVERIGCQRRGSCMINTPSCQRMDRSCVHPSVC
jgi:hypothetical protein